MMTARQSIGLCAAALLLIGPAAAIASSTEQYIRQLPTEIESENVPILPLFYGLLDRGQLAQLERAGIESAGDFIEIDPAFLGRLLELDPREARALQGEMGQRFPVPPAKGR